VPLGARSARVRGRVVLANPPEAALQRDLPTGMAVRFRPLDDAAAAAIDAFVEQRLAALAV
jgi:hypothetical protein